MHFITGSKFTVASTIPQQKTHSVTSIPTSQPKPIDGFERGTTYTIYYIDFNRGKIPTVFTYTFISSKGIKIIKDFDSTVDADMYISKLSNIVLPDYKDFYQKQTS